MPACTGLAVAEEGCFGHCCWPAGDVYSRGQTLEQHWQQLRQRYGGFEYRSGYFIASPPSKSAAVFERLRSQVPASIGGCAVTAVRDLGTGVDTAQPGEPWAGIEGCLPPAGGTALYALPDTVCRYDAMQHA